MDGKGGTSAAPIAVSYTHLDVYKRQELEDELLEEEELELLLGLGSNSNESPPPAEELLDEFPSSSSWYRSVSYTHLDVYKRQLSSSGSPTSSHRWGL